MKVQIFLFFSFLVFIECAIADSIVLRVGKRELTVNGKKAQVYEVKQPDGTFGLSLKKGDQFDVVVENHLDVPTGIHWHGLILPNNQDGVPFVTQAPIQPGEKYPYQFPIIQAGTFWMHTHYALQEQLLLAAPLILHEADAAKRKEVVMFLVDFTFENPYTLFEQLKSRGAKEKMGPFMKNREDLNDVTYDAFLANWKTLSEHEVIEVQPGEEILLRIVDGSSTTNFFIHTGTLQAEAVAVDGSPIVSVSGNNFSLAVAQRLDLVLKIPVQGGVFPIIAQGEGLTLQTGIVLKTAGTTVPFFSQKADASEGAISYAQEFQLKATQPLKEKGIDRRLTANLQGNMEKYIWMINGKAWPDHDPLMVKEGERVEILFVNHTSMAHPMHLHGHVFQVTEINGIKFSGAQRDTILVLPHSTLKVQFDATNPGNWPLHCHNLYHQFAGMMTTLNYEGFKGPVFSKKEEALEFEIPR